MNEEARIAGAPVSWGVIEIPDWGYQMPAERVLREAASLGLAAVEAGPEDLLPRDPSEVSAILAGWTKVRGGSCSSPCRRWRRSAGGTASRSRCTTTTAP